MSAWQPCKRFACDLCSQTFHSRQGLKIQCQKQECRRRQTSAGSAAASQHENRNSGASHGQGHRQQLPGSESRRGDDGTADQLLDPEGPPEDFTAKPASGADALVEALASRQ